MQPVSKLSYWWYLGRHSFFSLELDDFGGLGSYVFAHCSHPISVECVSRYQDLLGVSGVVS